MLARTRAEVRALSHLMRERRFAALPDGERLDTDRVTVIVSRGMEDERATSPLEIARGDQLRIGATHWEKQLFNGTVVTVDDFKVQSVPIRLSPIPTTSRELPSPRVKLGLGRAAISPAMSSAS